MDFWSILKVIFFLLFILGLMYLLLYVVKKYFYSFENKNNKQIRIKVLGTQTILPKRFIQVVQVHDKILVLGVSDHSINLLKEFENGQFNFGELPVYETKDNFMDLLRKNLGLK